MCVTSRRERRRGGWSVLSPPGLIHFLERMQGTSPSGSIHLRKAILRETAVDEPHKNYRSSNPWDGRRRKKTKTSASGKDLESEEWKAGSWHLIFRGKEIDEVLLTYGLPDDTLAHYNETQISLLSPSFGWGHNTTVFVDLVTDGESLPLHMNGWNVQPATWLVAVHVTRQMFTEQKWPVIWCSPPEKIIHHIQHWVLNIFVGTK